MVTKLYEMSVLLLVLVVLRRHTASASHDSLVGWLNFITEYTLNRKRQGRRKLDPGGGGIGGILITALSSPERQNYFCIKMGSCVTNNFNLQSSHAQYLLAVALT